VPIATTRITQASHQRFAQLSGDLNPIHADPIAAATMEPGAILAYGMDMVLWSLESLAERGQLPVTLYRLRARFNKWVYIEDEIALQPRADSVTTLDLLANDAPAATLEFFLGERKPASPPSPPATQTRRQQSHNLSMEALEGVNGTAPTASATEAAAIYPALASTLGPATLAELATCSYIIGMEAPGLHSMSMRYDISLTDSALATDSTGLHFHVTSVDPRFRRAKIAINGTHITGTLEAIVRP
jgi:hypothetical protein